MNKKLNITLAAAGIAALCAIIAIPVRPAQAEVTVPASAHTRLAALEAQTNAADRIDDLEIDFGTGSNQVSASDMPDEDLGDISVASGVYSIDSDALDGLTTNFTFLSATAVTGQVWFADGVLTNLDTNIGD
jgi:hypothetical protein